MNVLCVEGICLFCDLKDLTFRGVKLHTFSHCSRLARSVCRTSLFVIELIVRYKAAWSAKSLTLDLPA